MQERVKVFTFVSGHGETLVEPPHEDRINQWLSAEDARVTHISQSESDRSGAGHHITICVWYVPAAQKVAEAATDHSSWSGRALSGASA